MRKNPYITEFQNLKCSEDITNLGIVSKNHKDKITEMIGVYNAFKKAKKDFKRKFKGIKNILVTDNDAKPRVAAMLAFLTSHVVINDSNNPKFTPNKNIDRLFSSEDVEELFDDVDVEIVTDPTFNYNLAYEMGVGRPLIALNHFPVNINGRKPDMTYVDENILTGCNVVSIFVNH